MPTATKIWPAANWMERETYDFYGILFGDHPNLQRILNVEDMTDFPMRKDFPLEDQTREDKDDSMFGR
jgi:NADH-quinone oxidoreductase subunit C